MIFTHYLSGHYNYTLAAHPTDFPGISEQEFKESAARGEQSLNLISDMVMKFANEQNESYETFKKFKFGVTLNPEFNGRPTQPMSQMTFNARFKSELIKVISATVVFRE